MKQDRHTRLNWMDREEIVRILEHDYGTACFDDESTDFLRECLREQWQEDDDPDPDGSDPILP